MSIASERASEWVSVRSSAAASSASSSSCSLSSTSCVFATTFVRCDAEFQTAAQATPDGAQTQTEPEQIARRERRREKRHAERESERSSGNKGNTKATNDKIVAAATVCCSTDFLQLVGLASPLPVPLPLPLPLCSSFRSLAPTPLAFLLWPFTYAPHKSAWETLLLRNTHTHTNTGTLTHIRALLRELKFANVANEGQRWLKKC